MEVGKHLHLRQPHGPEQGPSLCAVPRDPSPLLLFSHLHPQGVAFFVVVVVLLLLLFKERNLSLCPKSRSAKFPRPPPSPSIRLNRRRWKTRTHRIHAIVPEVPAAPPSPHGRAPLPAQPAPPRGPLGPADTPIPPPPAARSHAEAAGPGEREGDGEGGGAGRAIRVPPPHRRHSEQRNGASPARMLRGGGRQEPREGARREGRRAPGESTHLG